MANGIDATCAFASPRTWSFVNDTYQARQSLPKNVLLDIYKGTVGEGPAAEFMAFADVIKDLPSVDEIKLNPTKTVVPESPATLFALTTALASAVSPNNMDILMKYIDRMPAEFQVVFMRDALIRDDAVAKTKSFMDWGVKNGALLS